MTERVSTMDVRARIGDMLNLRHDEFVIERRGPPLASALVPVGRLKQMRRFARHHAIEILATQDEEPGERLSRRWHSR